MRPTISWSDLRAGPPEGPGGRLASGQVGVWGLGVEGLANLRALISLGRQPVLVDDHPPAGGADGHPVLATSGAGLAALAACDVVIKSPGISR
jgi:UDP-N-acetylmuramoylalanine--D-glutamate ligase